MTATLWGLTVGDLIRSRVYGTARTYRVLGFDDQHATIRVNGQKRRSASVRCDMLADAFGHPRETVWIRILESDDVPLELGGWGESIAVPITVIQHAPPPVVQLDLFAGVRP